MDSSSSDLCTVAPPFTLAPGAYINHERSIQNCTYSVVHRYLLLFVAFDNITSRLLFLFGGEIHNKGMNSGHPFGY